MRVDLPEPLAPRTAMISPSLASPEMSLRRVLVPLDLVSLSGGETVEAGKKVNLRRSLTL